MKLIIDGIKFEYKSKRVLNGVSFEVKNEVVAILGKNGAGKSTLLKAIANAIKPIEGKIKINDISINSFKQKEFVKKIGYIAQKQNGNSLSVFEYIMLGRRAYFKFRPTKKDIEIVNRVIKILDLEDIKDKVTSNLSGGELQRVSIARVLVQESEVILLDEPTNNLDLKNQIEVLKFIRSLNKTAIIVIHDINLALRFCDKFIFLKDGRVEYEGDKSIVTSEVIKDVFDIEVEICFYKNSPFIIPL